MEKIHKKEIACMKMISAKRIFTGQNEICLPVSSCSLTTKPLSSIFFIYHPIENVVPHCLQKTSKF